MPEPHDPQRGGTPPPPDGADRAHPSAAPPANARGPRHRVTALRAVLIGLAVLVAAAFYGWFDLRRDALAFRTEVAQRLTSSDAALAAARARESDIGNDLREAQAKLTLLEARLAESQSQQAALEALYREMTPSREELALTEVEQMLSLASQQLTLAGNVQAALAAVQLADAKLARLDRPQYTPLRRALARDMDRLKAVPYVDVAGISVKLDQMLEALDDLRLARDERLPAEAPNPSVVNEPGWQRFLRDAWDELRSLVRIEVSDRPPAPLLTPQESFFLRENLRLRLLAARLALLSRDERSFKTDLHAAREWLDRYFDTRSRPVMTMGTTLEQLEATPMPVDVPDLSASLDAVRLLRAMAERAPDASAVDVPASEPAPAAAPSPGAAVPPAASPHPPAPAGAGRSRPAAPGGPPVHAN
jgi:uroporphyrin-3 C-methyltransferase